MTGRTILAMGGGGLTMEPDNPTLDEFVRGLAPRLEPRILFLPTASGDADTVETPILPDMLISAPPEAGPVPSTFRSSAVRATAHHFAIEVAVLTRPTPWR